MALSRLSREIPTINGFPVDPSELGLPRTELNPDRQDSYNNHHMIWTARRMALLAMTQTWRDLAKNQHVMPRDVHAVFHDRYDPPKDLPDLTALMDEIDEAYQTGALLRYGSATTPTYNVITESRYRTIQAEYNRLHE